MESLRERLKDWCSLEEAEWHLGIVLGLWEAGTFVPGWNPLIPLHRILWGTDPVYGMVHQTLVSLAAAGVLDYDEATDKVRWNPDASNSRPVAPDPGNFLENVQVKNL